MRNWKDYGFIVRSVHRKSVFDALDKPKTPTQLAREHNINLGYISNILISLIERKLIDCLNPDEKRHRLYERNKKGNDLLDQMKDID